jgi:hypothetical protein
MKTPDDPLAHVDPGAGNGHRAHARDRSVELEEVLEERTALPLLLVPLATPVVVVVPAVTVVVAGLAPIVVVAPWS